MVVIMFYDQELTVEPFATEVLATASNTMGCDSIKPLLFFQGGNYEEN